MCDNTKAVYKDEIQEGMDVVVGLVGILKWVSALPEESTVRRLSWRIFEEALGECWLSV